MPRRRKSDRLHVLQGTARGDRHDVRTEAIATGKLYAAPPGLTPTQKILWRNAVRSAPPGVLAKIDLEALKLWVQTADRVHKLQEILDAEYGQPGWADLSAHRSIDRAAGVLLRLTAELGFSPASRPRLRIATPRPSDDESNPWVALRLVDK
jgi:phage terminase small subunit